VGEKGRFEGDGCERVDYEEGKRGGGEMLKENSSLTLPFSAKLMNGAL
jgi:hypothetical protein